MLLNAFGCSFGLVFGTLGGHLRVIWALLWLLNGTPNSSNFFFGGPGAPNVPPKQPSTNLNSAPSALIVKQKAPGNHQCPHFGTDAFRCPTILDKHPPKKDSKGHRQGIPEATLGLSTSIFFLSFLILDLLGVEIDLPSGPSDPQKP